ncbi:MAG: SHOCT domain-containing protein [Patescibacteria group bacterium]
MFNIGNYFVKYITGIASINRPADNYILSVETEGIKLSRFTSPTALIKWVDIQKITSESQGEITKSLSIGKAAVGLVLLGPLGALIGAGMRSTHDNRVMFVHVAYKDEDGEVCDCILQTKQAFEISNKLVAERKEYYRKNNLSLISPAKTESNLDQLAKLAELKDRGVITTEEFELKKKQLLGL